jgi:hypothetical protein
MPLGQTITVINNSGKVVSTGKQLASVFKEAKAAYQSRKAEIRATKDSEVQRLKDASYSDENLARRSRSPRPGVHRANSSATHRRHSPQHEPAFQPSPLQRGFTDTALANDAVYAHPTHPPAFDLPDRTLIRRNSTPGERPDSAESFDEHLAYGPLPPPLPMRPSKDETELREKFWHIKNILEEANCVQYSATATIEHLQKHPDALAAVGLALAEASAMIGRVGPAAFVGLKASFPAVVALLASPQFLVAAGLGIGVTIVMLGGYKIIKHVKQKKKNGEEEMEPLQYVDGQVKLPPIEMWRRGIADAEVASVGTTVDGEFITPGASKQLIEAGVLDPSMVHPTTERRKSSKSEHHRHGHSHSSHRAKTVASESPSHSKSRRKSKSHREDDDTASKASSKATSRSGTVRTSKKRKAVSGLKLLFQGRTPATAS